jgi:glycerol-3-phosphate dehydrogenase
MTVQNSQLSSLSCDLLVIGGGINGVGIARDAAGRGLSVILCEQHDLAQHTSSASSKLIHGGLRYLEYYEFKLVRKALQEREILLRAAPHIVSPLRFVMPHHAGQRPAWMIRAGLFLYDHLARRSILPGSQAIAFKSHPAGAPLQARFTRGFEYSDGWVDDARLVVLSALDAHERGARILTRTRCLAAQRAGQRWQVTLQDAAGRQFEGSARALVNAGGPWAAQLAAAISGAKVRHGLRLVKGSHIVVRRRFAHRYAYLLQNPDKRIIFALPYQAEFTLIGTTDLDFRGDPGQVAISDDEVGYLCQMANRYFRDPITAQDVVWSYAGVRPLLDDNQQNASAVSRDYLLECDDQSAPLLNVWGGKLTTYRKLAEEALALLLPWLDSNAPAWTESAPLPGGDLQQPGNLVESVDFDSFRQHFERKYPWLPPPLAQRYTHAYGSRAARFLEGASQLLDLGQELAPGLYAAEAAYLRDVEWARSADDILWRRTKLGLYSQPQHVARLQQWLNDTTPGAG